MGLERKTGGERLLKLNIGDRPIANKYCEGKMQRTLERELKVPETVVREANWASCGWWEAVRTYASPVPQGLGVRGVLCYRLSMSFAVRVSV